MVFSFELTQEEIDVVQGIMGREVKHQESEGRLWASNIINKVRVKLRAQMCKQTARERNAPRDDDDDTMRRAESTVY